jgi:membrane protease YdiL (CAAX protease family)
MSSLNNPQNLAPTAAESAAEPAAANPGPAWLRYLRTKGGRLAALLVVFAAVDALGVGSLAQLGATTNPLRALLTLVLGFAVAVGALRLYTLLVHRLEQRDDVAELPAATRTSGLRRGILLGLGLFTVTIALIAMFGGYRAHGWGSFWAAVATLGVSGLAAAVVEELMFRAVLFRIVEEWAGTRVALIVSALLFGLLHLINPDATVWGALAIAIEAGLMLGAAYSATRSLWVPIGLHLGWNFAEGGLFGVTVSGSASHGPSGLLDGAVAGHHALVSGGQFGPEASIFSILVCSAISVYFLRKASREGNLRPRRASH